MSEYFSFNKDDPLYEVIINFIEKHKKSIETVLDVGCSNGYLLSSILKQFPQVKAYGLDNDKQLVSQITNKKIKGDVGDIGSMHYDNEKFDLVIAKDVIEHSNNNLEALGELVRVSKKYLFISAPAPFTEAAWGDVTHLRPYTKSSLSQIATIYNLKPIIISSIKRKWIYRIVALFWQQPIDDIAVYGFYRK